MFTNNNKTLQKNRSHYYYRLSISIVVVVCLASLILWGLVAYSDPRATISNCVIHNSDDELIVNLTVTLTNPNHFRGFNYSTSVLAVWMFSDSNLPVRIQARNPLQFRTNKYQGFNKALHWDFNFVKPSSQLTNSTSLMMLKSQKSWLYAYLTTVHSNKILFWKTTTTYNRWLEANMYFSDDLTLKEVTHFNRITDFSFAFKHMWIPS